MNKNLIVEQEGVSASRFFEADTLVLNGKKVLVVNPYTNKNNVFKGQLHCHTSNSPDAVDTPISLLQAYKNAGYAFVVTTDHDFMTSQQSVQGILHIKGSEEGTADGHIIAVGNVNTKETNVSQDVINLINDDRAFSVMAHPDWVALPFSNEKLLEISGYYGIEVFNSLANTSSEDSQEKVDYVLRNNICTYLIASDDCHNISGANFNKGWIYVYANELTQESIMESLKRGNFYSSNGANLTVTMDKDTVYVETPDYSNIEFVTQYGKSKIELNVKSSSYKIYGDEKYVRVNVIRISDNKKAWSNPIQVFLQGHGGGIVYQTTQGEGSNSNSSTINFATNSSDIFRCNNTSSSGWVGTISSINGNVITFTTISGNANSIFPASQFNLGKLRLYNSSKSNDYVLITNGSGNSLTLDRSVSSNWSVGQTITANSPYVTSGIHYDIEIVLGNLYGKSGGLVEAYIIDSLGANATLYIHPFESFANSKQTQRFTQSSVWFSSLVACKINQNVISLAWKSNGSGTMSVILRESMYL